MPPAATIFHVTTRAQWEHAQATGTYRGDTLDTQGFIHCSTAAQVAGVANAIFRGRQDLILLRIDSTRVQPEIRYEPPTAPENERFPHIYGPLNADAVLETLPFEPGPDGSFRLPKGVLR